MPGETTTRWIARIPSVRSSEKYCRVEVEGSRIEDEPIALVKEARLAVVIAALPEIVDALRNIIGSAAEPPLAASTITLTITMTAAEFDAARAALAKMEGRDAADHT